jgi:hypothetical protein
MIMDMIVIEESGDVTGLYGDWLHETGIGTVKPNGRASEVEYELVTGSGGWDVRLTDHPRNGVHGGRVIASGCKTRAEALALEVGWIQENILAKGGVRC